MKILILLLISILNANAQSVKYNPFTKKLDYLGTGGGGGGDITGASNAGSGSSVFYQKSGATLQFNGVKATSNKVTVTLDAGTHDVSIDIAPSNINLTDLNGNLAQSRITNLVTDLSAKAPTARQIICGSTLSGCGDLSADRTLDVINDTSQQRVGILKTASLIGTRQSINLLEGVGTSLTVTDNSGSNRVDVTVSTPLVGCLPTLSTNTAFVSASCKGYYGGNFISLSLQGSFAPSSGTGRVYAYLKINTLYFGLYSSVGSCTNATCENLGSDEFPASVVRIATWENTSGTLSSPVDVRAVYSSEPLVAGTDIGIVSDGNGGRQINFTGTSTPKNILTCTNDTGTGTTVNRFSKINASGQCVVVGAGDTELAAGVTVSGAGTSGSSSLQTEGITTVSASGTTTAGQIAVLAANGQATSSVSCSTSNQNVGVWTSSGTGDQTLLIGNVCKPPSGGSGDVVGPASATNEAVPLYDGTTGKLIKNSILNFDTTNKQLKFDVGGTATGGFEMWSGGFAGFRMGFGDSPPTWIGTSFPFMYISSNANFTINPGYGHHLRLGSDASGTGGSKTLIDGDVEVNVTNTAKTAKFFGPTFIDTTGSFSATTAVRTAPSKSGTSLPGTCTVADTYIKTDATNTALLYLCHTTNNWVQQIGTGVVDPGANGIVARTGAGTSAARTVTGTSNEVLVTNGNGVSGNPVVSLPKIMFESSFCVGGNNTRPVGWSTDTFSGLTETSTAATWFSRCGISIDTGAVDNEFDGEKGPSAGLVNFASMPSGKTAVFVFEGGVGGTTTGDWVLRLDSTPDFGSGLLDSPANAIGFRRLSGGNIFLQWCVASSCSTSDTSVGLSTNTEYRFTLEVPQSGDCAWTIESGSDYSTVNSGTAACSKPTGSLLPRITARSDGAVAFTHIVRYFKYLQK